MPNVFDYIEWRGDLSFKAAPFNPVDNIIFSIISYYPFDGIVENDFKAGGVPLKKALNGLEKAIRDNSELLRLLTFPEEQKKFIAPVSEAKRYQNVFIYAYKDRTDTKKEMQFSALTFIAPDCPPYIAFRGTDASLVGWKEDFNMIFNDVIPAQTEAVKYLKNIAPNITGKFNIGGHSKGGNLAVYAAAFCGNDLQKQINTVYNNDAPGFNKKITECNEYKSITKKIESYIPQDSVVGLLFENDLAFTVVKSVETGFMQHNPFSWQIRRDNMVKVKNITRLSKVFNKTLMDWLYGMDMDTRKRFIEALYEVLDNSEIQYLSDFNENLLKSVGLLIKSTTYLDKTSKDMLNKTFAALFDVARKNLGAIIKKRIEQKQITKNDKIQKRKTD